MIPFVIVIVSCLILGIGHIVRPIASVNDRHSSKFPEGMASYFRSRWDIRSIWRLPLAVEEIPMRDLEWHLNYPFWSSDPPNPLFDLEPRLVLENPSKHEIHANRLDSVDERYPIDLGRFGEVEVILDGIHRLAKLHSRGDQVVKVRRVPQQHLRI